MNNTAHTPDYDTLDPQYTPRKWEAKGQQIYSCDFLGTFRVAEAAHYPGAPWSAAGADRHAKLIASAPELLEALRACVRVIPYGSETIEAKALAAIAKATGGA